MTIEIPRPEPGSLPAYMTEELDNYEQQIRKYRTGEVDETKMQKLRLHFGTYAQRQEGVQMQRIKIPGGFLTADQLIRLADAADQFGSGFIHFTTREDAQIYYVKLEQTPDLLRFLAEGGITSREACGNTVRNITACYRAGTSASEAFNVGPYAEALFRYLVRNKYNQNLGRKFKITFEGCAEDHSGLRIHDVGLSAARVPLYQRLVDPFTADEALWEFENLFFISGETQGEWEGVSSRFEELKKSNADEAAARTILEEARNFVGYCTQAMFPEARAVA